MRLSWPDGFKRSGSFSRAALLGGGYREPVLEVFEGHDCKNASVVSVLHDYQPSLIRWGVDQAFSVAAAFLGGDGD
jgi:hypothetical protein